MSETLEAPQPSADFPAGPSADFPVISKEEVRGTPPEKAEAAPTVPDRELVAPKLQQYLDSRRVPEPDPLEQRLARIEAALTQPAETGAELSEQQILLQELRETKETLARQAQEAAQREEAERIEAQERTLREGLAASLKARETDFPGLLKLKLEGRVYSRLTEELQNGTAVSEDDIASEEEGKVRYLYEQLHEVYGNQPASTKSEEAPKSEAHTPTTTLTQSLASGEEVQGLDELVSKYGKAEAARIVWERTLGQ
jgi:hypothetical protein